LTENNEFGWQEFCALNTVEGTNSGMRIIINTIADGIYREIVGKSIDRHLQCVINSMSYGQNVGVCHEIQTLFRCSLDMQARANNLYRLTLQDAAFDVDSGSDPRNNRVSFIRRYHFADCMLDREITIWYGMFLRDYLGDAPTHEDYFTFIDNLDGQQLLLGPLYEAAFRAHGPPTRLQLDAVLDSYLPSPTKLSGTMTLGQRIAYAEDVHGRDTEHVEAMQARASMAADSRLARELPLGGLYAIANATELPPRMVVDEQTLDRCLAVDEYYASVLPTRLSAGAELPEWTTWDHRAAAVKLDLFLRYGPPQRFRLGSS